MEKYYCLVYRNILIIFILVCTISCTGKKDAKNAENTQNNESAVTETMVIPSDIFDFQYEYKDTVMYVSSPEGLNVRNSPNITGDKIGALKYLTEVLITDEDANNINIDGIDGKWVQITTPVKGWVFSGYLEKKQNEDLLREDDIIGEWRIIDNDGSYDKDSVFFVILDFMEKGRFVYGPYGTGFGFFGTWKVVDETTIELKGAWSSETSTEEDLVYETVYLRNIKYIDNNRVTFYNGIEGTFEIMKKGLWD